MRRPVVTSFCLAAALTGCGGGKSASGGDAPTPTPTAASQEQVREVVDGACVAALRRLSHGKAVRDIGVALGYASRAQATTDALVERLGAFPAPTEPELRAVVTTAKALQADLAQVATLGGDHPAGRGTRVVARLRRDTGRFRAATAAIGARGCQRIDPKALDPVVERAYTVELAIAANSLGEAIGLTPRRLAPLRRPVEEQLIRQRIDTPPVPRGYAARHARFRKATLALLKATRGAKRSIAGVRAAAPAEAAAWADAYEALLQDGKPTPPVGGTPA